MQIYAAEICLKIRTHTSVDPFCMYGTRAGYSDSCYSLELYATATTARKWLFPTLALDQRPSFLHGKFVSTLRVASANWESHMGTVVCSLVARRKRGPAI